MTVPSPSTARARLVDLNGNPVLTNSGPIHFDPDDTDVSIAKDGTVSTSQGIKGKLTIAEFTDPQQLSREGTKLWSGGTPKANTTTQLLQGSRSQSNPTSLGVTEMAQMIRVQRAYQQMADLMSKQDTLRTTAVQKLGSLNA